MENKNIEVEISSNDDQDVVWDLDSPVTQSGLLYIRDLLPEAVSPSGFDIDIATTGAAGEIMAEIDNELMAIADAFSCSNADEWKPDAISCTNYETQYYNDFTTDYEFTLEPADTNVIQAHPFADPLSIHNPNGDLVVRIAYDGEVTLGDTIKPSYAAEDFWRKVANIGGKFQEREECDAREIADLETEVENEQSMRLELQEIIDDIANALGVPQSTENDIADHAAKLKENFEALTERFLLEHGHTPDVKEEDPIKAYDRAMKMVR